MKLKKYRNALLALIGLVSLAAYIIACRASFSPDGKKVLFPYLGAKGTNAGVALLDRETGRVQRVFTLPAKEGKPLFASAGWTPDGKKAVIAWLEDDDGPLQIEVITPGREGPSRRFSVPVPDDAALTLVIPPPVVGRRVFFGGKSLLRLDLETGEVRRREIEGAAYPIGHSDQVYYARQPEGDEGKYEVGKLDRETLAFAPLFRVRRDEHGEMSPFIALSRDASRVAVVCEDGEEGFNLLVFRGGVLAKKFAIGTRESRRKIGNIAWSPDGKTIYSTYYRKLDKREGYELGCIEVDVSGSVRREISLLRGGGNLDDEEAQLQFQVAVSPKGDALAAAATLLDPDDTDPEDRALYLVDLTTSAREVRKFAIPSVAPSTPAAGNERE